MRALYTLALYLLLPWALLHLVLRSRRQPEYLRHVGERFGAFPAVAAGRRIWIHAVSVGETRAAEPLVKALRGRHPDHRILLTHATPTGRQTGLELFGDSVDRAYLPYDWPWAMRRFLDHYRPALGVVMETELWPNLIEQAHRRGVPVYLANARMSERSARGYARFGRLTGGMLRQLAGVGAQTAADARRLEELGAPRILVTGNVKFDREVPPPMLALGEQLKRQFGAQRPVFLAASTREGEEALLLDALEDAPLPASVLIVIVPRHPQRFDEVAALLARRGLVHRRRSDNGIVDGGVRYVVGDSMGELYAYYAACDVAFVGGSLLPLGGQNLLEACAVGRPVLVGPHTFNFEEATHGAIEAGAARRVRDAAGLAEAARELLADAGLRARMSEAGRAFTAAHRGATARTMEMFNLKP
jgi:3-deoxy-D-manno-octulosonic-acid transferase